MPNERLFQRLFKKKKVLNEPALQNKVFNKSLYLTSC